MASAPNRRAEELAASQAALEQLVTEQAATRMQLECVARAGGIGTARLRRRAAVLDEQLFAARVVAKQCLIATFEAELTELRNDYDEAVRVCADIRATDDGSGPPWEQARERLLRAASRLRRLERERIEHSHALAALLQSHGRVDRDLPWQPETSGTDSR